MGHNLLRDPIQILKEVGGYYECPESKDGELLGPLVGYAGQYEPGKHWVGKIYVNFARLEEHPAKLHKCASWLELMIHSAVGEIDVFCGAPLGGLSLATMLGFVANRRYVFVEKKVTKLAHGNGREESILVFGRHEVGYGDRIIIVEDVTNNFSTTNQLIRIIHTAGAKVVGIATFLNRSLEVDDAYEYSIDGVTGALPVISLVRKKIQQFRQECPEIREEIIRGNIVWKPKHEWPRLMDAMTKHAP